LNKGIVIQNIPLPLTYQIKRNAMTTEYSNHLQNVIKWVVAEKGNEAANYIASTSLSDILNAYNNGLVKLADSVFTSAGHLNERGKIARDKIAADIWNFHNSN
jgi:hypothetical protein